MLEAVREGVYSQSLRTIAICYSAGDSLIGPLILCCLFKKYASFEATSGQWVHAIPVYTA